MKHRNVSSDEEDLQKAVQDLGLVVLGKFLFMVFLWLIKISNLAYEITIISTNSFLSNYTVLLRKPTAPLQRGLFFIDLAHILSSEKLSVLTISGLVPLFSSNGHRRFLDMF